jgi:hypothetical protein
MKIKRQKTFTNPLGGTHNGLAANGVTSDKALNTTRMQADLGMFGPNGNSVGASFKRAPIMTGDFASMSNKNNLKAYKYLIKNDRLQDFRTNYGKKGYRIEDVKKEMKQNGEW